MLSTYLCFVSSKGSAGRAHFWFRLAGICCHPCISASQNFRIAHRTTCVIEQEEQEFDKLLPASKLHHSPPIMPTPTTAVELQGVYSRGYEVPVIPSNTGAVQYPSLAGVDAAEGYAAYPEVSPVSQVPEACQQTELFMDYYSDVSR